MPSSANSWWVILKTLALLAAVAALYLGLLAFPEPLFPIATAHASITFRTRTPLDSLAVRRIAGGVLARVSESELYDPSLRHRIFVLGDRRLWALFNGPYQGAIARNFELGNGIFIPQLDTRDDRIVHFDGRSTDVIGILAHEIAHTLMERNVGLRYWRLPWWKREGYPEYIGSARATRLDSPPRYREAALAWKHLLEDRRMTFAQIIQSKMSLEEARR